MPKASKKDLNTLPENIVPGQLLFSPDQAAAVLSLGKSTLYRLIKEKKIQCLKHGTRAMIHKVELERYISTIPLREA